MKILKKIFKKKKPVQALPKIKIKAKQGRWCNYYGGRLPFPIECQSNKKTPIRSFFKSGKKFLIRDRSLCTDCTRDIEWIPWKRGEWDKIKEAVKNGEDLRDMDPPMRRE